MINHIALYINLLALVVCMFALAVNLVLGHVVWAAVMAAFAVLNAYLAYDSFKSIREEP